MGESAVLLNTPWRRTQQNQEMKALVGNLPQIGEAWRVTTVESAKNLLTGLFFDPRHSRFGSCWSLQTEQKVFFAEANNKHEGYDRRCASRNRRIVGSKQERK